MRTIYRAQGSTFYAPTADEVGMVARDLGPPLEAMSRLLILLQAFVDEPVGVLGQMPEPGLRIYENAITGGYLILAVTDQDASVYAATLSDLVRHNLPVPQHQEAPAC